MNSRKNYKKWTFNENSNAIHHLQHNHIIIWNKGVCVAGFDKHNALILAHSYTFEEGLTAKDIENIILDDHLLGGNEPVVNIWYTSDRQSIFPKQLYKEDQAKAAIAQIFFVDHDEHIAVAPIGQPLGQILYVIPKALKEKLELLFPVAISDNLINANPNRNPEADIMVTILPNMGTISAYNQRKLIHYTTFDCASKADIMYYIGLFQQEFLNNKKDIIVDITGYGLLHDNIINYAKDYYKIKEHGTESFFKYLPTCE